jgi:hypothetical protein
MPVKEIRARAAHFLSDELAAACGTTLQKLVQFVAGQAELTPAQLLKLAHRLRQTHAVL